MVEFTVTVENVISFTVLFAIFCIVMRYVEKRRFFELASKFDGPSTLPLIGNAHVFIGDAEDYLKKIHELANLYPGSYRLWIANRFYVFFTETQLVKTILLSPKAIDKGYVYGFVEPFFGTGLGTAHGSKWKRQRKLIQPTFNMKILNPYTKIFHSQSKILAGIFEKHLNGPEFEIFDLLARTTLDMICETVMGVQIGAQTKNNLCYVEALQTMCTNVCKRMFSIWLHPDLIFNLTKLGKDQQRQVRIIQEFTTDVIRTKEMEFVEGSSQPDTREDEDDEFPGESDTRKKVFLDYLMKLSRKSDKSSDEELRDEVTTMILAGHDTTAITNTFVMLMLASHPGVQEKVYHELCEIYGNHDVDEYDVTYEDLSRMEYLECVIKETMRLFPVFPNISRAVKEDLDLGERTLPKGSEAVIAILEIHRNNQYWPHPLTFDPDRFLPENVSKRDPYCYLAFSAGPRNCIGWKHGLMAMKTLMATILRRYILKKDHIVPVRDIRLKTEIILKPVHPITIRIEERFPRN